MIKDRSLDLVRQILLFYIVVRIIMGIPVPNAMTQILVSSIMGILEMCRYRRPFCLDALHCFGDRHYRRIALRCGRHVEHCLGENNLGLRHPDPLHSLGRGYRHRKCHGIGISYILGGTDHNSAGNKADILPCVEHLCQIIDRRIRIRSPHTFDECGNCVVMIVSILIIAYNPLLNTFGDDLKRQVNHPVYTPLRRQYGKFHRIQSKSCVSSRHISQKLEAIRFSSNPYNVNRLTLRAGAAALAEQDYYDANCAAIVDTRADTKRRLEALGFTCTDSRANFLFARHPAADGGDLYRRLKERGVLVRRFDAPRIGDYIRITIGTRAQMDALLERLEGLL